MKGFHMCGTGSSDEAPVTQKRLIANSQTLTIGDAVAMNTDDETAQLVDAGNAVYGIVLGFEDEKGSKPPRTDGAGGDYYETYTAAADNETVDKVYALINTSKKTKYHVAVDDTLGTTGNSDQAGQMFDVVAASDELDESTASTSDGQFYSHGKWKDDETQLVVSINESSVH